MGAFFTNIQLSTSGIDKSDITEKVINFIIKLNTQAGFIKVEDENEADKSVIISPAHGLAWISIYDEDTEDLNIKKLNKIAAYLSKEFKTSALSILVNDSDTVYVGLINNGTLKDKLSNRSKNIDFNKSKASVWSNILASNYSFDDIKIAWQNKSVFVEDFLNRFAKLINLDSSKLLTGYEYLNKEKLTKEIKLNFAKKDKKATELGLTKFRMLASVGIVDVKSGEKETYEWIVTNQGDASTGLDIVIAGECITNDLLIPELVKVGVFRNENTYSSQFIETVSTKGEKIFYAKFDDFIIPNGYKTNYPMTTKESKRYGMIQYERGVYFNITFIGGKEGTGEFTVYFSPLVNRQKGGDNSTSIKGTIEDWRNKNAL
ncbi:MAG: hypothetical protein K2X48_20455 [Chitinophagaceae bacterium]|nr:hypothetical protein [Chitinophagaceae bacterium]